MLAALCNFLLSWATYLGGTCINFFIDCVNAAILAFVALIITVAGLLPAGTSLPSLDAVPTGNVWVSLVQGLNWVFPISFFVQCLLFVITSLFAYVAIAPLARWVKLFR